MSLRTLKLNSIRSYHVIDNDSVKMTRFPGGYLDRGGNAFYYLTDYQGNNIAVVDAGGVITQRTYYYPYGEPWRYPDGQQYLFSDKELTRADGRHVYAFPARTLLPNLPRWTTPDPLAEQTPWDSPYAYCAANPIANIDPLGLEVKGVSQDDAFNVVQNLRQLFIGDEFNSFRGLIRQSGNNGNGKSLAKISDAELTKVFNGISLSEDQQALVDITVSTINDNNTFTIQFISESQHLCNKGIDAFSPELSKLGIDIERTIDYYGYFPNFVIESIGGLGLTSATDNGAFIAILSYANHTNGLCITVAHELLGHARSLSAGIGKDQQHEQVISKDQQHEQVIRLENLVYRVLGINHINTGSDHADKSIVNNPSQLPDYR